MEINIKPKVLTPKDSALKKFLASSTVKLEAIAAVASLTWLKCFAVDDGKVLTDLFSSEAFRGSWKWFDKLNWLGAILNGIISVFCFISLFAIVLQTVLTISYFAIRPFWDNVHQIKTDNATSQLFGKNIPFGMAGYIKETFQPSKTSGIDSLVNILYAFLPDVKAYSEMNDDKEKSGLSEDDTLVTWFVKTFPKKVLIILMLSMGFNGTLMKCYGMVVDGLGVFAERFANYQLDDTINRLLDSGSNFDFNLGDDKTNKGATLEAICKKCYTSTLSSTGVTDASAKQQLGSSIQNSIRSQLNDATVLQIIQTNGHPEVTSLTDDDWKYINYTVTVNSDGNASGNGETVIDMSNFINSVDILKNGDWQTNNKAHVSFVLSKKAPMHDYINN